MLGKSCLESSRRFVENRLKMRVYRARSLEHGSRPIIAAQRRVYHSRVEVEACVSGLEMKCTKDMRQCRVRFAVAIERPGERVVSINIVTNFEFSNSEVESLLMIDVVVRLIVDENAIIEHSIEGVQARDKLDQLALFLCVFLASQLCVDIA